MQKKCPNCNSMLRRSHVESQGGSLYSRFICVNPSCSSYKRVVFEKKIKTKPEN